MQLLCVRQKSIMQTRREHNKPAKTNHRPLGNQTYLCHQWVTGESKSAGGGARSELFRNRLENETGRTRGGTTGLGFWSFWGRRDCRGCGASAGARFRRPVRATSPR
ncbi:hypothetical protein MTP99_012549 [Tenebrio molitor]|nr:hypothetical protein MTP99_012549 [Tenebrio molitor]